MTRNPNHARFRTRLDELLCDENVDPTDESQVSCAALAHTDLELLPILMNEMAQFPSDNMRERLTWGALQRGYQSFG